MMDRVHAQSIIAIIIAAGMILSLLLLILPRGADSGLVMAT